jgi:pimeloyl-ACP methyl ester carboxylesterase
MTDVAFLIPGIMGSTLARKGAVIWPASVRQLPALYGSYKHFDDLMADDLEALDAIRNVCIRDVYGSLIVALQKCGFREDQKPPTLYVFHYDWRKDNALAAKELADRIDGARAAHGDAVRVTLVAHSMGGLVARYYLESGDFAARPGLAKVARLITLATPHRGAPLALTAALGLEKRLWLNARQVQTLANDDRFASVYQLLPPRDQPFVWRSSAEGQYDPIDIYDDAVAGRLGLNRKNLAGALAFHKKLDVTTKPAHVRYFAFAGTAHVTVNAVTLLTKGAGFEPRKIDPERSGDQTVPIWSALLPGLQGLPVGGSHAHDVIFRDGNLRRTLGVLFGKPGVLAGEEEEVEVALREHVVHASDVVPVVLRLPSEGGVREGRLQFERAVLDAAGEFQSYSPAAHGPPYPIRLTSQAGEADTLSVSVEAPDIAGAYRLAFYWAGNKEPAGQDELFVQQPGSAA